MPPRAGLKACPDQEPRWTAGKRQSKVSKMQVSSSSRPHAAAANSGLIHSNGKPCMPWLFSADLHGGMLTCRERQRNMQRTNADYLLPGA